MMQLTNVLVNFFLFFILVPLLGFYGVVISFSLAIVCSYLLAYLYKFRIGIASGEWVRRQFRILYVVLLLTAVDVATVTILDSGAVVLIALPAVNAVLTVMMFRRLHFFTVSDIERYMGQYVTLKRYTQAILIVK